MRQLVKTREPDSPTAISANRKKRAHSIERARFL